MTDIEEEIRNIEVYLEKEKTADGIKIKISLELNDLEIDSNSVMITKEDIQDLNSDDEY